MAGASFQRNWFVRKEKCVFTSSFSAPCWQPFHTLSLGTSFVFSVMCLGLSCGKLLKPDFSRSHSVLVSAACEFERGATLHHNGAESEYGERMDLKHSLNKYKENTYKYIVLKLSRPESQQVRLILQVCLGWLRMDLHLLQASLIGGTSQACLRSTLCQISLRWSYWSHAEVNNWRHQI